MSTHIEMTITAPDKKTLYKISDRISSQVGPPDLDVENLTAFIVVGSHGDRLSIKNDAEELGCSVKEDIEDDY